MNRFKISGLLLAAVLSISAWAQSEAVVVKRATELRDAPTETARSLSALPLDTPLTRLPVRQGAWMQVRTEAGVTGWVHLFDLGSATVAAAPSNSATGALRGLTNFFKGGSQRANTTTATSTVGIRGLGAEDIAQAQPNLAALAQAEALRQDATQARRFAADSNLRARQVEALPTPAAPTAAPTETNLR
jgi:hypothetical protein